jgi:hypothetical protein
MEDYKPFLSSGFVSIIGFIEVKPIHILSDTGAGSEFLI